MYVSRKHPFSLLVSGGRGVGKTPKRIVWCYAKHQQDWFEELPKMNVEYVEDIPGELDKYFKKNKRNLIILDDLMDEASKSLKVTQLFTRGRHDNLFVIYLTKNLLHNSDYMVIFKNPRDNSQFAIARQIRLYKVKFLMWTYKDATSSLHSYLMLGLKPETEERFRMRSHILEDPRHVYITH